MTAPDRAAAIADQYATILGVLERLKDGTRRDLRILGPFDLWRVSVDDLRGNIRQQPLEKQRDFLAMLAVAAIVRLAQQQQQPPEPPRGNGANDEDEAIAAEATQLALDTMRAWLAEDEPALRESVQRLIFRPVYANHGIYALCEALQVFVDMIAQGSGEDRLSVWSHFVVTPTLAEDGDETS